MEIADPKGIFCMAIKKAESESKPRKPRRNNRLGLFPMIDTLLTSMTGSIKANEPIALKNTICNGWKSLKYFATTFIQANAKVAKQM